MARATRKTEDPAIQEEDVVNQEEPVNQEIPEEEVNTNDEQENEDSETQEFSTEENSSESEDAPEWAKKLMQEQKRLKQHIEQTQYVNPYSAPYQEDIQGKTQPYDDKQKEIDEIAKLLEQRRLQQQRQNFESQRQQQFSNDLNKAKVEIEDFDEKVMDNPLLNSPQAHAIVETVKFSSMPSKLLYYLATKGKDNLNKIMTMHPYDQAREVIKLEARLEDLNTDNSSKAPPPPTKTKNEVEISGSTTGIRSDITHLRKKLMNK